MAVYEGWVDDRFRPRLVIRLTGIEDPLIALLDTGFTDWVWLPRELVPPGTSFQGRIHYLVATGRRMAGDYYISTVDWFGSAVEVLVITPRRMGGEPLIGVRLLRECFLEIDFPARTVKITR